MDKMLTARLAKADWDLIMEAARIRRSDLSALVREATVRLAREIVAKEKRRVESANEAA